MKDLVSSNFLTEYSHEFISSFLSLETKRAYARDLKDFFDFLFTHNDKPQHIREIKSAHLIDYRDHLQSQNLTDATINRKLVCLRSLFKWCVAMKLIEINPMMALKLPKSQAISSTTSFDDIEAWEMIHAPDITTKSGRVHKLILVLLFNLGLRRSELSQIKCSDIYVDRGHTVLKIKGKGGKTRYLPINEYVMNQIEEYKTSLLHEHATILEDHDYLIQTHKKVKNDRPIDGSTIYRIVTRYAKSLGINKKVGPHSCRSTVISHLLDTQRLPIRDVADFAGHSNVHTTQRYDKKRKGLDDSAAYQVNFNQKHIKD